MLGYQISKYIIIKKCLKVIRYSTQNSGKTIESNKLYKLLHWFFLLLYFYFFYLFIYGWYQRPVARNCRDFIYLHLHRSPCEATDLQIIAIIAVWLRLNTVTFRQVCKDLQITTLYFMNYILYYVMVYYIIITDRLATLVWVNLHQLKQFFCSVFLCIRIHR